ncbi:hypothetical protein [Nonomuraea sp. JJY05]|uniref:hypothetical protein n=1 Tax=Nonomuraea sp. JJY05 TaxID=3350255 RepID=UPI00373E379C
MTGEEAAATSPRVQPGLATPSKPSPTRTAESCPIPEGRSGGHEDLDHGWLAERFTDSVAMARRGHPTTGSIDGVGVSSDEREARWLAVAGALERYSSSVYSEDQFLRATAAELGEEALDLDQVPRIADAEAADPCECQELGSSADR